MAYITLVFSTAGLLSPAWRGSLIMALLIVFAAMGIIAGSFSTWIFTSFKLLNWKKQVFFTAVFYPGIVFMVSFFLNLLVWQAHSTKAIPFADMIMVVVLWFGVSVPLVYLGGSFVMRQGGSFFDVPLKYNPAPRRIGPPPVWYQQPNVMCMAGGSLVFLSCCIQVFFILKSIWFDQFYYVFGVLLLVGTMLVIISAEVAIIVCYTQLRNEDYR